VAAAVAKKANGASGRELDMAMKLIDEMSEKWHPEAFKNTYRDDLMKRIEQKVKAGQTHSLTQPEAQVTEERAATGGKVIDLMSLLQRSLEQRGRGAGADAGATRASKRKHSAVRRRSANSRTTRRA
jgi:DNA end-binding protein Ku